MRIRLPALFAAGALLFSLAGCSSGHVITQATPTPRLEVVSTPTPSPVLPSATPEPRATPSPVPAEPTPTPAPEDPAWMTVEGTSVSFGMGDSLSCPLVVSDARVGLDCLELSFTPAASAAALTAFQETQVRIPNTALSHDASDHTLMLTLHNTTLSTGELAGAAGSDDWVFDFVNEYGLSYPASTPMGAIGADNHFFSSAAISSDGTDTVVSLALSEHAQHYRIESGSLDAAGYLPYVRIVFQES